MPPVTALMVVDHGSRRAAANEMLVALAQRLAEHAGRRYVTVEPAHMELAEPTIGQAFDRCAAAGAERRFHKANYSRSEFADMLTAAGFTLERMEYVENMPFLYKFPWLRHPDHRRFDEHRARGEGYRLSVLGQALQGALIGLAPASFCNINVATARAVLL